jgi:hypothetical protein
LPCPAEEPPLSRSAGFNATMKVLLQHPIKANEISGVATFIRNTQELLARSGVEVRTLPTASATKKEIKEAVAWADVVHLSSNHGRTFLRSKLSGKPIVIQYHYPFWGTWKTTDEDRNLDFWKCWSQSLRIYWLQGKGRRFSAQYWEYFAAHIGRALLRVLMCWAADARITCSEFMRNDSKIPWPVTVIPYGLADETISRVGLVLLHGPDDSGKGALLPACGHGSRESKKYSAATACDWRGRRSRAFQTAGPRTRPGT